MDLEIKTNTRTELILTVMRILAWVAFIGISIKTGALLISYGVSFVNPEAAKNLYKGMNLYKLKEFSFWQYTIFVSFMVVLLCLKATVLSLLIKVLSNVNLANPFKIEVARILEKISYLLLDIWIIAILNSEHNDWLLKRTGIAMHQDEFSTEESLFMAGLVFIIAQVFKRGVEIQSENELTV